MPRTLKRRSDAISRDEEIDDFAPESSTQANRHPRRSSSVSSAGQISDSDIDNEAETQTSTQNANIGTLSKKLIRLALSSEYSRNPLRRTDIIQKVFKDSNAPPRLFKPVFGAAQKQLKSIFGMELAELPSRDKTTLKDRRTQATQPKSQSSTSSVAWILVSTLPKEYKTHPGIIQPNLAPSADVESSYTALYTFILSLIFLNNSSLTEAKLERYLKRVNADTYTPFGTLEKLLQRMIKDGYIEKRRDTTSGEEVVEFVPGPRGKVEVGVNGVAGLVRSVYGLGSIGLDGKHATSSRNRRGEHEQNGGVDDIDNENQGEAEGSAQVGPTVKIDRDELEQRLKRSLGVDRGSTQQPSTQAEVMEVDGQQDQAQQRNGRPKTRRRRRRLGDDADDDDDEDYQ